jgi:predicted DCC family thiol-disulfide oxidoreductase YuxK
MNPQRSMSEENIIFFDGVCGLCNRTVDFVLREDRALSFLYSPLQGETFRSIAHHYPEILNTDSIVVLRRDSGNELLLQRSDAVLYILDHLPRYLWVAWIGHRFPAWIRDALYRVIASTRYRIWGKRNSCRLPGPEERTRFLP